MIELVLILFGSAAARRRWWVLALTGIAWLALGAFIFVNAFIEEVRINPLYFTIPLVLDGLLSLVAAFGSSGTGRGLRYSRAAAMLFVALLIYATAGRADMVIGFVVGTLLVADAAWRAVSAHIVRFPGWGRALLLAGLEFLIGVWSFLPWPTRWQGQVGQDVGMLLMFSALGTLALAWRLARLPAGVPMSRAVAAGLLNTGGGASFVRRMRHEDGVETGRRITGTVHVWTPTGALASVDQAVSRYVAALDAKGVISTGHAALEADGLYVSHYPAVEMERSATDFRRTLRATRENDVPGRFLPSYREEADGWTESTMKIGIPGLDEGALRGFWAQYSSDTTYNLTNRNCSSTVATALEAGLEGIFARHTGSASFLLRLLLSPELWIAAQMRRRAAGMAWTPGIVLDYARALSYIVALPERLGLARGPALPAARAEAPVASGARSG